jgi:F-type H+-transporting ATPase subunit epsilon
MPMTTMMDLKLMCLTTSLIDQPVRKIVAEGEGGTFCLLPNHVDYVASLLPGIFTLETVAGQEQFFAIDTGILVKQGTTVWVSVQNAVAGDNLEQLQAAIQTQFTQLDDQEEKARSMLARLESSIMREFINLGGVG